MILRIAATVALIAVRFPALAQERPACSTYVGTVLQPLPIDAAIFALAKLPKIKGEYETSEQFAARQAAALPGGTKPLIISKALDLKNVRFYADQQVLNVSLYAFDNLSVSYGDVFGHGTPYDGKVEYGAFANIDVVISEREAKTGTYAGRNAFGARARVTEIMRVTKAIFDRAAEPGNADLFINSGSPAFSLQSIAMTAQDAKRIRPTLSGAFVVYPKWPFVASGVKDWGAATIDDPEEVRQRITAVVADIHCALLLDGVRKVLAAYEAR